MEVTCPRCLRSLSTGDPNGPPVFCMFCGQKLRDSSPDGMRTSSFVPFSDSPEDVIEPPPEEIGGYRLLRCIGSGGMGTVYEAEAPQTSTRVAVKLLSSRLASSPSSVERFRQEGRLASQLSHPRCVFVLAADTDAGRPYIVMELMPGRTLKDLVDQAGPLSPVDAVTHILDVIDGLAEAHRLGVLHRDVKPSNCFLTVDERVKIGDFGLSKSLAGSDDRHLTQSGTFLGTVLFASPEQIRGQPLDYGSDIYAVCATLYYLICGEAPYHHESITAALAKAISEPPPSISGRRPDVPRAIEKVVMKGLERDRDRRWASLADLHEALVDSLPDRQTPARPRVLVGAYLLDRILIAFLAAPIEILRQVLSGTHEAHLDLFELRWVAIVLLVGYFAVGEGVCGVTVGKWLFGLRVSRVGQTGPPGLWRGFVRTIVFIAITSCIVPFPELLVAWLGQAAGGGLGAILFGAGVITVLLQLRRTSSGYRGIHDFASGCHVTQRPLPARKLRLVSAYPNPIDILQPAKVAEPVPQMVGGYAIRGRVWGDSDGEQVWAGEDPALARRVLLWVLSPSDAPILSAPSELARSTRLRRLGRGSVRLGDRDREWAAFAAPVGVPLVDAIHPDRPLPWADARFLLEQLVDELQGAEVDGSTPTRLGLGQVWVEPNGRVQLLDFPMPTGSKANASPTSLVPEKEVASSPFPLLRQVVSLTLEGRPRAVAYSPGRRGRFEPGVRAPVPPHAAPILTKLFAPDGYRTLGELHHDLLDTHVHPPEVTPSVRAAHLGIQAAILAVGLLLMFSASGALAIVLTKLAEARADLADHSLAALRDPGQRDELAHLPGVAAAFDNPRAEAKIEGLRDQKRAEALARRNALLSPQRAILGRSDEGLGGRTEDEEDPRAVQELLVWAALPGESAVGQPAAPLNLESGPVWAVVVFTPLVWVIAAAGFRGGASMIITGVAVVRPDGRRAYRWQCALRAVAVWLPVTGLLVGSIWLQEVHFARAYTYVALWLLALALLPVYVVIALRSPTRPPQDWIAGTSLVPA